MLKRIILLVQVKEIIQKVTGQDPRTYELAFKRPCIEENKTLEEYDIKRTVTVTQVSILEGGGGFGLVTVDVSKNKYRIVEFDENAPFYRLVVRGLNVQAICGNGHCKAYNDLVNCTLGFVRDFNLINKLSEIRCPSCENEVYPKNFGFLECEYRIYYEKWEDNKKKSGEVKGKAENKFKLFDEYSSGNANFSVLIFNVYR